VTKQAIDQSRPILDREMPTTIGAVIYARRKNLHWCRHTLAEKSTVGRYQIKAIEEGRGWPKPESVRRILETISAAERELGFAFPLAVFNGFESEPS
jgi:predicted transcriptional regulator